MKAKTVKGLKVVGGLLPVPTEITIRAERTGNLTTLSLADDEKGLMLHVNYDDVKDVIKGL